MHLVGEIVVERPDRGDLSSPGGRIQPIAGVRAVLMLDAVPGEIRHVAVDVRQRHRRHKAQVYVHDVDLVQRFVRQSRVPGLLEIAEKIPQVQKVFVHGPSGVGLDGLVI